MSKPRVKETIEKLPVTLNEKEKLDFGQKAANLVQQIETKTEELKDYNKQEKADIGKLVSSHRYLSLCISTGRENRDVNCTVNYDFDADKKDIIRKDTKELVRSVQLESWERQESLDLKGKKNAKAQKDALNESVKENAAKKAEDKKAKKKAKKDALIEDRKCENPECGKMFTPLLKTSKYCCDKCKDRAKYLRKHSADEGKAGK